MKALSNQRALIERVLSCPSTQEVLDAVRKKLVGKRITSIKFTIENNEISVSLQLSDKQQIVVNMPDLSLAQLLRNPQIAREEQDIYYQNHVYRPLTSRVRKRKGRRTREPTDTFSPVRL